MMMDKVRFLPIFLIVVTIFTSVKGFSQIYNISSQSQVWYDQSEKIKTLLRDIDKYYVDSVDLEETVEKMIVKALKDLDPHSVYIPKKEVEAANEQLEGKFEGIGIQFNIFEDTLLVVAPIIGGPSEKLGIQAGDKIIKIEDENVAGIGLKNSDVMKKLRGDKGTEVNISIKRYGERDLIDYTIVRDKIPIYSVDASYMIDSEIGYIKLSRFAKTTMRELHTEINKLKELGMNSLILDLTGNTGGYLHIANQLSDQFLEDEKLIVFTKGKYFSKRSHYASEKGLFESGRLVIMIDAGSASASEIVSGAVQDWDRGLIVGRRSFGKGLVQKPFEFPDSSVMRLTIQRYYTPSGRCIQKPYEDYRDEYSHRFDSGELFHKDSIKVADSLVYKTNGGRKVYGGGGIIPDVFVPLDTSFSSKYYRDILRKGLMYNFSLAYLDKHRKQMEELYPDVRSFDIAFEISDVILSEFIEHAEEKGIERNDDDIKLSDRALKTYLKAYIARGLWGTSAFYYVSNEMDAIYAASLNALKEGTYEKNNLRK